MAQNRRHSIRREALLDALNASTEHPSAEMLYHALKPSFPDLSLGTVYRNLTQLREDGEIVCIANVDGHERFDGVKPAHVHFICECCHRIFDLWEHGHHHALASAAAAELGFEVRSQEHVLRGLCTDCRN